MSDKPKHVVCKEGHFEFWHLNDKLHRDDGPAFIYEDGRVEYWVHGKKMTEEEFNFKPVTMDEFEKIIDSF